MKIVKVNTKLSSDVLKYSFKGSKENISVDEVEKLIHYLESNSNSNSINEDKITLFLNSDTNEEFKEGVEISSQLLKVALKLVKELVEEKETLVFTEDKELTTQEAADYLNVSRPYLIKLIEEGKIPFRKVGTHRRIKFTEVIKYDNLTQEQQLKGLAELTKQAQELNLGYE